MRSRSVLVASLIQLLLEHDLRARLVDEGEIIELGPPDKDLLVEMMLRRREEEAQLMQLYAEQDPWSFSDCYPPDHLWGPMDGMILSILSLTSSRHFILHQKLRVLRLKPTVKDGVSLGATLNSPGGESD